MRLSSLLPFAAFAACATASLVNPLAARADVTVFSNFGTNNTYGASNAAGTYAIVGSSDGEAQRVAMRFTAATSVASVTGFDIALTPGTTAVSTATLSLYADNGTGTPFGSALMTATQTVPASNSNQSAVYTFSSAAPVSLNAGTSYWLVAGASGNAYYLWNTNTTGDTNRIATDQYNNAFTASSGGNAKTGAFAVRGIAAAAAPEPGTLPLLGMGLVSGLGMLSRRRKAVHARAK